MCQEPFMRMWVRRTRSPENRMSRCLPAALTSSTVRPASGASSSTRVRTGRTESKRVTTLPASARCSVRAARKIESPSGTPGRPTAHVEAHRGWSEAALDEVGGEGMLGGGHAVDLGDEQAAVRTGKGERGQLVGDGASGDRALGLVFGPPDGERAAAAGDVGRARAI